MAERPGNRLVGLVRSRRAGVSPLPTYPFERQEYWPPTTPGTCGRRSEAFASDAPCLADHAGVLPAVAALDLVLATVEGHRPMVLKRIVWNGP